MTEMTELQIWRGLEHYVRTSSNLTRLQPIMHDCVLAFCVSRVTELEAAGKEAGAIEEPKDDLVLIRLVAFEGRVDLHARGVRDRFAAVDTLLAKLRTDLKAHKHFDRADDAFIGSTGKCYYP